MFASNENKKESFVRQILVEIGISEQEVTSLITQFDNLDAKDVAQKLIEILNKQAEDRRNV